MFFLLDPRLREDDGSSGKSGIKNRRGALESEAWRVLSDEVYAALKGEVKLNFVPSHAGINCC